MPKIRRALLTVYDKTGIVAFARGLRRSGVRILSTGNTAKTLRKAGVPVEEVSEYTGFPELLDGRVKTLHPKIHAGILADRSNPAHMKSLKAHGVEPIDLVAVDLYPFKLIDIGGVALLRAAAKNFKYVTVVPGCEFYGEVLKELSKKKKMSEATNRRLAQKSFEKTSRYDRVIHHFLNDSEKETLPQVLELSFQKAQTLRYGENPHQEGALYVETGTEGSGLLSLQGKKLSFNNLLDFDAAYRIAADFKEPCVAIIKHGTPCGVSLGKTIEEAFDKAWECDPESAFGGVVGMNRPLNGALANRLREKFLEVVASPRIEKEARGILKAKKDLRLIPFEGINIKRTLDFKPVALGLLAQTEDHTDLRPSHLRLVTQGKPTPEEIDSLIFAFRVARHVRSNAIVIAQGVSTVGIGGGQPSRVGSVRLAVQKSGAKTEGAVLASDGFFPFPDNIEVANAAGIRAIIQPGGSIRDKEVIDACDRAGIRMVFTGIRHFKH